MDRRNRGSVRHDGGDACHRCRGVLWRQHLEFAGVYHSHHLHHYRDDDNGDDHHDDDDDDHICAQVPGVPFGVTAQTIYLATGLIIAAYHMRK